MWMNGEVEKWERADGGEAAACVYSEWLWSDGAEWCRVLPVGQAAFPLPKLGSSLFIFWPLLSGSLVDGSVSLAQEQLKRRELEHKATSSSSSEQEEDDENREEANGSALGRPRTWQISRSRVLLADPVPASCQTTIPQSTLQGEFPDIVIDSRYDWLRLCPLFFHQPSSEQETQPTFPSCYRFSLPAHGGGLYLKCCRCCWASLFNESISNIWLSNAPGPSHFRFLPVSTNISLFLLSIPYPRYVFIGWADRLPFSLKNDFRFDSLQVKGFTLLRRFIGCFVLASNNK